MSTPSSRLHQICLNVGMTNKEASDLLSAFSKQQYRAGVFEGLSRAYSFASDALAESQYDEAKEDKSMENK